MQATCSVFKYFKTPSYGLGLGILGPRYGEIFYHRNSSAMVINIDFIVTDIKQTCLGQGLGVTITARKRTSNFSKLMFTSDP